MNGLKLFKAI